MKNKIISLLIVLASLSSVSYAQDKATLDLLVSKGVITKAEADNVSKNAVAVKIKEKAAKSIEFSGRVQAQYQWISGDADYSDGSSATISDKNGFQLRRVYLGAKAGLGAGWYAELIGNFATDGVSLDKAYIQKKVDFDFLQGDLKLGYQKVNFGYEENTSSSKLLTVERSIATRFFVENDKDVSFGSRYMGAFWNGKVEQVKGLGYSLAVTNADSYTGTSSSDLGGASVNAWLGVSYKFDIDDFNFNVGVNSGYGSQAYYAQNSELMGLNPYFSMKYKGLTVWGEYIITNVEEGNYTATDSATPQGLNLGVEYKFDIGEMGALGIAARYSWVDSDNMGIKTDNAISKGVSADGIQYEKGQSVYLGLNWYIMGNNVKFQTGYEWAQFNGNLSGDIGMLDVSALRAQMQILF